MKKVFLDCGANNGQSIIQFIKFFVDHKDYEVHSFECTKSTKILNNWKITAEKYKENVKLINLYEAAIWIENREEMTFYDLGNESSSVLSKKTNGIGETKVKTINLSDFIIKNFKQEDKIILKIDIEGAEYEVFKNLFSTGAIKYIDKIYGELHGPKCGVSFSEDVKLINKINDYGLKMFYWDASNDKTLCEKFYTEQTLYEFHKKYGFKAGF